MNAITVEDLTGTPLGLVEADLGGDDTPDTLTARGTEGPDAFKAGITGISGVGARTEVFNADATGDVHQVAALGGDDTFAIGIGVDGKAVVAQMKKTEANDIVYGKSTVRADGRVLHPAYLFEVKKPSESKGPGDLYHVRATIPANEAFRPMSEGNCPLVKG